MGVVEFLSGRHASRQRVAIATFGELRACRSNASNSPKINKMARFMVEMDRAIVYIKSLIPQSS